MMPTRRRFSTSTITLVIAAWGVLSTPTITKAVGGLDPLPSWNDGAAKAAILDFVARTTRTGSPDLIPAEERIAVFDNDGTLWPENPLPFELAFTFDDAKARLAKIRP